MRACVCVCVCVRDARMGVRTFSSIYMRENMCVYMHACIYILQYLPPQVLKLTSLALHPPPNIEKLPTPMH